MYVHIRNICAEDKSSYATAADVNTKKRHLKRQHRLFMHSTKGRIYKGN